MYRFTTILKSLTLLTLGCTIGILFFTITSRDQQEQKESKERPPLRQDAVLDKGKQDSEQNSKNEDDATRERVQENITKIRKQKIRDCIALDSMNEIRQTLVKLKSVLAAAHRLTYSGEARVKILESYGIIHGMLSKADPVLKSAMPFQDKGTTRFNTTPVVCPEVLNGTGIGYPFFYKGFVMKKCTNVKPFREVLTVALDFHEGDMTTVKIRQILSNIDKHYKNIPILMATRTKMAANPPLNVKMISFRKSEKAGKVWNRLIDQVKTDYVFIGRDLEYFDWNSRLERLVREISYLGVPLAGTSVRTENGHWTMGCQQFVYRNYTLKYREGYDISKHECVYCNYVRGPFVALKSTVLLANALQSDFGRNIVFEDLFMQLYKKRKLSIVCPDAMSYIKDNSNHQRKKTVWLQFAKKYALNRIYLPSDIVHEFTCSEAAGDMKSKGMALPPCSLQNLADGVKFFMKTCEDNNIICELQEGTLLGAVKFNKVLPWERDADLTFSSANFTALKNLQKEFKAAGYSLSGLSDAGSDVWCCADGRIAGGKFYIRLPGWQIEVYGQHIMDTEKLANLSMPPTKVFFDGMWVNTPRNPALYVRNRYGREIFRHAQHWMTSRAMSSGWGVYNTAKFSSCPQRGAHMCLDQYFTDGNLQFEVPTP